MMIGPIMAPAELLIMIADDILAVTRMSSASAQDNPAGNRADIPIPAIPANTVRNSTDPTHAEIKNAEYAIIINEVQRNIICKGLRYLVTKMLRNLPTAKLAQYTVVM